LSIANRTVAVSQAGAPASPTNLHFVEQ
jgi:hypothetical protein